MFYIKLINQTSEIHLWLFEYLMITFYYLQ